MTAAKNQEAEPPRPRLTLRQAEHGNAVTETLWQQVGGTAFFERLVADFYAGVQHDELLAPMYPDADWEGAKWRLQKFLEQYWGGPTTYSEQRGHPRLRLRHAPFRVTPAARDRWLHHMYRALDNAELAPLHDAALRDYVTRAAHALVNNFDS
ncbi:globin [Canibacter oris]|uniref:Hemoglobin n=1 Tax=Canibacter oris TaxID=1365628 RepID=A0A840DKC3_9MICO|nr:globin [Canibacter oris]MBB4071932.1 hemoglobin [Canibacter oris]